MSQTHTSFHPGDRKIIREQAKRLAEIASLPLMAERRRLWKKHNALEPCRPLILVFPEGSWRELLPDRELACETKEGRRIEWGLRSVLYAYDHFDSDNVVDKAF